MAQTANEQLYDLVIRHQVGLARVSDSLAREVERLLDGTEADLRDRIEKGLDALVGQDLTKPSNIRRLEKLLEEIKAVRSPALDDMLKTWQRTAQEVAEHEVTFIAASLYSVTPVELDLVLPELPWLRALATTLPFEGSTLAGWAAKIAAGDLDRITSQIRIGLVQGESARDIARRVVGTASLNGSDGVTEVTRNGADAITRTAVNAFASAARAEFSRVNSDIIQVELFVATLDGRTTAVCRSEDGHVYKVGEGPVPPLHVRCRSLRVPYLDPASLSTRPMVASTKKLLLSEWARDHGLGTLKSRDDLPRGTKGQFDAWARGRVRELTGPTPAATTYEEFLKRQSTAFQDDVLGKTKALLFRKGELELTKFVNRRGGELTLAQLAKTEAEAFRKAGLDPARYTR